MTIIPFLHRVLVKLKPVEKTTESGIIIPDTTTRKEQAATEEGVIIAIGETFAKDYGAVNIPQVGDKVYFAKYAGKFIKDEDGTDLVLLNDEDIVAIIKDEDA
jgi:chaperonin GroES